MNNDKMKKYIYFDKAKNEIIYTNDSKNIDIEPIKEEIVEKKEPFIKTIKNKTNCQSILNNIDNKQLEEDIYISLNKDKKYLDGDFDYVYKNKKEKQKTKKKSKKFKLVKLGKIFENFLKLIYFVFRVFLIFLIFVLISFSTYNLSKNSNKDFLIEDKNIEKVVDNNDTGKTVITIDNTVLEFKTKTIEYVNELNAIIEGEKICIENLDKGIINTKDVYFYFLKTQGLKETLKEGYFDYNIDSEYSPTQRYTNQMFIESINLSKSMVNSYLISDKKDKYINNMTNFINGHNNKIIELDIFLNNLE